MIACISPSDRFFEESVSTLNYATRAANISNIPVKNIDPKIKIINELKVKFLLFFTIFSIKFECFKWS